ncbi:MAG: biotin--[acetyl-CoA-carboxylase] ligase [Desulfuromonadaceae bacterium]|nr:biotin--[acetyl-CoA-carboxylase] ligase [Desulfuromonas sp.]MDY0185655.1 biotin--[acetyl-CoA-carboxylase] ligase [Desulfuromonadaceae bacterium]
MGSNQLRETIVRMFLQHEGEVISGEQLCQILGVSRTAVWKHIKQLRAQGYAIEAVPSRGYRLRARPDVLLPAVIQAGLNTAVIAKRIEYHAELDSTNVRAQMLAEQGAPEGSVVVAECQTSGRGRMGRKWSSPPGVNVYTSVILRPTLALSEATQLTFLAAVAVARAIEKVCAVKVSVKWPNDILLNGKKIAGLLNELNAETEGIHYLVLGIGVNLNMEKEQFPPDLRYPATSILLETGQRVDRVAFIQALFVEIDTLYTLLLERGFAPVRLAWEALFDLVGSAVSVDDGGADVSGVVVGIATDGALLLDTGSAHPKTIYSGDVRPAMLA